MLRKTTIVKKDDEGKRSRGDVVEDRFFYWCGVVAEVLVTTLTVVIVPMSQQYVYAVAVSGDFNYSHGSVSLSFHVRQNKEPVGGIIGNIQLGSELIVLNE